MNAALILILLAVLPAALAGAAIGGWWGFVVGIGIEFCVLLAGIIFLTLRDEEGV